MSATLPLFIWEDGGAVFLNAVSRTIFLERPAALALQRLLSTSPTPDFENLRDWLLAEGCEFETESDCTIFCADLMEISNQVLAELEP